MVKLRNSGFRVTIRNEEQAGINKLKPESFEIDYLAWQHKPEWRIAAGIVGNANRKWGIAARNCRRCKLEFWEVQTGIVGNANRFWREILQAGIGETGRQYGDGG